MLLAHRVRPSTLLRLGMFFLILFSLMQTSFIHANQFLGEDLADGARGAFIGLSIGFNLLSIVKKKKG